MVTNQDLLRLKGQRVRLVFNDGVTIRGRLVTVDPDRFEEQVVYEVDSIESTAGGARPELQPGGLYASDTGEIRTAEGL